MRGSRGSVTPSKSKIDLWWKIDSSVSSCESCFNGQMNQRIYWITLSRINNEWYFDCKHTKYINLWFKNIIIFVFLKNLLLCVEKVCFHSLTWRGLTSSNRNSRHFLDSRKNRCVMQLVLFFVCDEWNQKMNKEKKSCYFERRYGLVDLEEVKHTSVTCNDVFSQDFYMFLNDKSWLWFCRLLTKLH